MSTRVAYPIAEFSRETKMNRTTIWRKCKSGEIPSVRIGRNFLIPASYVEHIRNLKAAPVEPSTEVKAKDAG